MSQFHLFKTAVQKQFNRIKGLPLFFSNADRNELWDTYINTLTEAGHNEVYRERGEHDCQCCKHFIRKIGNIVAIDGDKLVSIWDIEPTGTFYDATALAMAELTKTKGIRSSFAVEMSDIGTDSNLELLEGGGTQVWEHFFVKVPNELVIRDSEQRSKFIGRSSERAHSLKKAVEVLQLSAAQDVLQLIKDNVLYRGSEFRSSMQFIISTLTEYNSATNKELWFWQYSLKHGDRVALRNSVIGTLVEDLSTGTDLDSAVKSYETKVAPANYKRTTAIVTPNMIKEAEKTVVSLGIENSLARRPAVITDITVNNVLFADSTAQQQMQGVFGQLLQGATDNIDVSKAQPIPIETFLTTVVPTATKLEAYLSNNVASSNAMTLVAPVDKDAPSILKWNNNFSWAYNGDVTDSIKERVKKAGGNVQGALRVSLGWSNPDDLDLHMTPPKGRQIYFGDKQGILDVDMNAYGKSDPVAPVENMVYARPSDIPQGKFVVEVHNFNTRGAGNTGFTVEVEYEGKVTTFTYDKHLRRDQQIVAVAFEIKNGVLTFDTKKSLPCTSGELSREVWGLSTCKLHRISAVMLSPNHWDEQAVGNKHYFVMLEGFTNDEPVRGFYNEFLSDTLQPHRKVFELLGNKMKVTPDKDQLSGLGFSSTVRNSLVIRATDTAGKVRLYNVQF